LVERFGHVVKSEGFPSIGRLADAFGLACKLFVHRDVNVLRRFLMRRFLVCGVVALAAAAVVGDWAEAGCLRRKKACASPAAACASDCASSCGDSCGASCGVTYHNEYVTEKRVINVVEYNRVEKERTVKVHVPEWVEEERDVTVCEPVKVEKTVTVKKCVTEPVKMTGTRKVCRRVPVETVKTVRVCTGSWATEMVDSGCGSCDSGCGSACGSCCASSCCNPCSRPVCRRVWVPSYEDREVKCVSYQTQVEEVPYEYTVHKTSWVDEERKVTVCEMQNVTKKVKVKVCKHKVEERVEKYTVCEPTTVQKEIEVQVCRRVAVENACATDCCHSHCGSGCGEAVVSSCGCN